MDASKAGGAPEDAPGMSVGEASEPWDLPLKEQWGGEGRREPHPSPEGDSQKSFPGQFHDPSAYTCSPLRPSSIEAQQAEMGEGMEHSHAELLPHLSLQDTLTTLEITGGKGAVCRTAGSRVSGTHPVSCSVTSSSVPICKLTRLSPWLVGLALRISELLAASSQLPHRRRR